MAIKQVRLLQRHMFEQFVFFINRFSQSNDGKGNLHPFLFPMLQAVTDILLTKMLKRNVPVKSLVYGKTEPTGKVLKKKISIQQGLSKEQCKSFVSPFRGH